MDACATPSRDARTVFIADDDADLRCLLRLLIQSEPDLRVCGEACNGREALDHLDDGAVPDVLLVDVNMPHMDVGPQLRALRARCPEMEVVVYSGEDEVDGRRRIGDIGGTYTYVVKGRPDQLLARLRGQRGA